MKTDSKRIIAIMALTILASGCADTTQTESTGNSVISVNNFEALPDPVPAGQQFSINMELKNSGDSDAENVQARLFGPSFINSQDAEGRTENLSTLRTASDDNPAIPRTTTWNFDAPDIGENREVDYNIYSKIFYGYETRGSTDFRLVSQDRLAEQGYSQSEPTLDQTDAPIDLEIRGTTPKIFYEEDRNSGEPIESEICVVVRNEGTGQAFLGGYNDGLYDVDNSDEDTVELTIENIDTIRFEAENDGDNSVNVDLINGEEGYQCFTMIADASTLSNSETSINTRITAEYNYVEETETTVTVEGRRDIPDNLDEENGEGDFGDEPPENPGE